MIGRVFVPLDGSAEATSVLPWLEGWGLRSAELVLFHCLRPQTASGQAAGRSRFETPERAREYLTDLARELPGEPEVVVREGLPGDGIVTAALESSADLVVLGDTADPGAPRTMGRITEAVAERSPLPVLLVRTPVRTPVRRVRRILAPLDGRAGGGGDLELLRGIARDLHSEVILLHVGPPEPDAPELRTPRRDGGPGDSQVRSRRPRRLGSSPEDGAAAPDGRLNLIQQVWAFLKEEIAARTVMTIGSFVEETLGHEQSLDADVIAVAKDPGRHWAAVVRRADQAVLLYKNIGPKRAPFALPARNGCAEGGPPAEELFLRIRATLPGVRALILDVTDENLNRAAPSGGPAQY